MAKLDQTVLNLFKEVRHEYEMVSDYRETLNDHISALHTKLATLEQAILAQTDTPIQDGASRMELDYEGVQPPPKHCNICAGAFFSCSDKLWECPTGHLLPKAMMGGGRAEDSEHPMAVSKEDEPTKGWSATRCGVTVLAWSLPATARYNDY
jgi:hypothetical protein